MAGGDLRRSRLVSAEQRFTSADLFVHDLSTAGPLLLAGRHLVFIRVESRHGAPVLESIHLDRFHTSYHPRSHAAACEFSVPLPASGPTRLAYLPPYVVVVVAGHLWGVRVRGGDGVSGRVDLRISESRIQPSGDPGARVHQQGSELALTLGRSFALLGLDRLHRPQSGGATPLFWGGEVARSYWHGPVHLGGRWLFVDHGGALAIMAKAGEGAGWIPDTGFDPVPQLLDDPAARISAPAGVASSLFAAYRDPAGGGLVRLNAAEPSVRVFPHAELDFAERDAPFPLADQGVLWTARGGMAAFFAPSGPGMPAELQLALDGCRFHHRHLLQTNEGGLGILPAHEDGVCRLVAFSVQPHESRIIGRTLATLQLPWREVQSVLAAPSLGSDSPFCVIVQARERLYFLYPN